MVCDHVLAGDAVHQLFANAVFNPVGEGSVGFQGGQLA